MGDQQNPASDIIDRCCDPILFISGDGRILSYNPAAQRLWRLDERAVAGISVLLGTTATRQLLETEYSSAFEVLPLDAITTDSNFGCSVLNIGGGGPGDTVYLVTLQAFEPESARVAKHEEFLATVAHDLKNPLGAIFGYADALLDTSLSSGLSDKQREVIHRMRNTAFRTLELVRNFQHLAQLQSSVILPPARTIDLNQSLKLVVDSTWRPSSGGAKLILNLSPGELPVKIDKVQLERIIANLVNNALKYTPEGGTITIRSAPQPSASGATFEVHNSGSFIPKEELGLIFERYQRASTGKGQPGSGLGLFIVKSILDSIGGTIKTTSSENDGTSFLVALN